MPDHRSGPAFPGCLATDRSTCLVEVAPRAQVIQGRLRSCRWLMQVDATSASVENRDKLMALIRFSRACGTALVAGVVGGCVWAQQGTLCWGVVGSKPRR